MKARLVASYCFFYLRLLVPAAARLVASLASILGKTSRQTIERFMLPLCNRLFRPVFNPAQFLTVQSFSEGQDVSDFFTLCRRTGIDEPWFRGQRVLDAGCGSGLFAIAVAAKGATEVIGIDIDEPRIPYARKAAERQSITNTTFHLMSVYEMSFPERSFDRVISHTVFEHLPDLPAALSALHRVLKPGGEAFITHDSYRSRYGAHVGHFVNIPWPCAFFSTDSVVAFWEKRYRDFVSQHGAGNGAQALDLLGGGLLSLNKLTISEVMRAVEGSPFEVVTLQPYGEEKALLAAAPWLRRIPSLHEYLRGSLAMRLRRAAES